MKLIKIALVALLVSTTVSAAGNVASGKKVFKKINCALCHNADGMGKAKGGKLALLKGPQIAGLDAAYIVEQLEAIKSKKRKTKYTTMMWTKIRKLSSQDMADLGAYVHQLSKTRFKGMKQAK